MTHETVPFDTPDSAAEAEADARADADIRDGRLISHDAVKRWLAECGVTPANFYFEKFSASSEVAA